MILGESQRRHTLTPDLEANGGDIGYRIRPTHDRSDRHIASEAYTGKGTQAGYSARSGDL